MGRVHPSGNIAGVSGQLSDFKPARVACPRGCRHCPRRLRHQAIGTPAPCRHARSANAESIIGLVAGQIGRTCHYSRFHRCQCAVCRARIANGVFQNRCRRRRPCGLPHQPEGRAASRSRVRRPAVMRTMATGCAASRRGDIAWIAHLSRWRRLMYEATAMASNHGRPRQACYALASRREDSGRNRKRPNVQRIGRHRFSGRHHERIAGAPVPQVVQTRANASPI